MHKAAYLNTLRVIKTSVRDMDISYNCSDMIATYLIIKIISIYIKNDTLIGYRMTRKDHDKKIHVVIFYTGTKAPANIVG